MSNKLHLTSINNPNKYVKNCCYPLNITSLFVLEANKNIHPNQLQKFNISSKFQNIKYFDNN